MNGLKKEDIVNGNLIISSSYHTGPSNFRDIRNTYKDNEKGIALIQNVRNAMESGVRKGKTGDPNELAYDVFFPELNLLKSVCEYSGFTEDAELISLEDAWVLLEERIRTRTEEILEKTFLSIKEKNISTRNAFSKVFKEHQKVKSIEPVLDPS